MSSPVWRLQLMVLDAIVEDPDLVWLGTADEQAAHLLALTRIEQTDLPHVAVGEGEARTVRYFPDRLPIGIHLAGRGVVVYVVTDPFSDEFRVFLERHAALLRALPAWTLRIVVPPHFPDIAQRAKQVVWNQLLTPLRTEMLDELRWYFEQVRAHPTPSRSSDLDERFYRARDAFSAPRFKTLYRAWKQDAESALARAGSYVRRSLQSPFSLPGDHRCGLAMTLRMGEKQTREQTREHRSPSSDALSAAGQRACRTVCAVSDLLLSEEIRDREAKWPTSRP